MSITRSIVAVAAAAMLAVPSAAFAVGPPTNPGGGHKPADTPSRPASPSTDHPTQASNPDTGHPTADANARTDTPGPDAPASAKAKAYGKLCRAESKKHVKGQKGTPFSRCVTAMAKAATGEAATARAACAGISRKHTDGERGTPFSRCVVAASHLADQPEQPAGA
jgi:hypothetical protein